MSRRPISLSISQSAQPSQSPAAAHTGAAQSHAMAAPTRPGRWTRARVRQRAVTPALLGSAALLWACGGVGDVADSAVDPAVNGTVSSPTTPALPSEVTSVLDLPATPDNYAKPNLPAHFRSAYVTASDNTPSQNAITDAGATLGRVLFYDPLLSQNRTIACASCHPQATAFSDTQATSAGFAGERTARNTMSIIDARYYRDGRFFWDERAATLEQQVVGPIQSSVEMGMTLPEAVSRVAAAPYYPPLFQRAFGDSTVTADRVAAALAQFARSIVSYRSRFDQGLAQAGDVQAPFSNFSAEENQGKALFLGRAGCAACHLDQGGPPAQPGPRPNQALFFIEIPTNNGLDAQVDLGDNGVGDITGRAGDKGRFKSPSLRNVALTAPYMHDGRFDTLTRVVDFYNTGVQAHPNLDPRLRTSPTGPITPRRLGLSGAEVQSIVAFLGTLTDDALRTDHKFADPFRVPTRR